MIDDVPLPGMPPQPPPPPPLPMRATRRRSNRYCSDCVAVMWVTGRRDTQPRPVRWQITKGALVVHVCDHHKEQRMETP